MKSLALIAAASIDRGVEIYQIYRRSIDSTAYIEFLEGIAKLYPGEDVAIFLDNMRVHRSKKTGEAYKRLGIIPIFNIPYSPQFNGIEGVFNMIKASYKRYLLRAILDG